MSKMIVATPLGGLKTSSMLEMEDELLSEMLNEKLLALGQGRGPGVAIGIFKESGCAQIVLSHWLQTNKTSVELVSPDGLRVFSAQSSSGMGVVISGSLNPEQQKIVVGLIDKGFPVLAIHCPTTHSDEGLLPEFKSRVTPVIVQRMERKAHSPG